MYVRYLGHEADGCQTKGVKGIEIIPAGNAGGKFFVAFWETASESKGRSGRNKKIRIQ